MRIPGIARMHRGLRRLSNKLQGRALVLMYHRIADLEPDPQLHCVTPAHFAEHLEHLRRHCRPMSLSDLTQALIKGRVPRKAVVVTLDDGFADNLWNAKPLLERYAIPATVFVASGYVDRDREYPSDALDRCLLHSEPLPPTLTLTIQDQVHTWPIDEAPDDIGQWDVTMPIDPTLRQRCYRELECLLRPLDDASRQRVLTALANWASCPVRARSERRVLNANELGTLSRDGLVEIGAHSANHLILGAHPPELQWKEISEGRGRLQEILGRPVTSFSYPYGGRRDVSQKTIELAKEAGFAVACANSGPILVTARSDLFWLPRFLVRDWSGQEFAGRLRTVFHG